MRSCTTCSRCPAFRATRRRRQTRRIRVLWRSGSRHSRRSGPKSSIARVRHRSSRRASGDRAEMKLLVQPDAGIEPVLRAVKSARKAIDILIFRLDRGDLVAALRSAQSRGVNVRALIAHTNRGGEKSLRKLEMRLLDAGLTVTRTAGELRRYHGKMMIIDQRVLHLYGFNFTSLDIHRSRSFGVTTGNHALVREALKLFEADSARQAYTPGYSRFIVSPENSRERLSEFIKGAHSQLLIYDPQVSDSAMLRLLVERAKAGVDVRIIGKLTQKEPGEVTAEKYPGKRLHVRAIIRDG